MALPQVVVQLTVVASPQMSWYSSPSVPLCGRCVCIPCENVRNTAIPIGIVTISGRQPASGLILFSW